MIENLIFQILLVEIWEYLEQRLWKFIVQTKGIRNFWTYVILEKLFQYLTIIYLFNMGR